MQPALGPGGPHEIAGSKAYGLTIALALGLIFVSGCGLPGGLSPIFPTPVSPNGQGIYKLYELISIPAVAIFVLVEVLLVIIVLRFRRSRQKPGYVPPQVHGNTPLEIAWTLGPLAIVLAIAGLSFAELQTDFAISGTTIAPGAGPTDLEITVTAYQFGWDYDYPQGFTVNEVGNVQGNVVPFVVPVGKLVRLRIRSRDVIHSWWVPAITGKTDAVPGYDNFTWFRIDRPGQWRGQCAELCGVGHASMIIIVKAVPQAEFNQWVDQQVQQKQQSAASPARLASPSPSPSR